MGYNSLTTSGAKFKILVETSFEGGTRTIAGVTTMEVAHLVENSLPNNIEYVCQEHVSQIFFNWKTQLQENVDHNAQLILDIDQFLNGMRSKSIIIVE
jgi:hypothetical protein